MRRHYDLVYQSGIANVFRVTLPESEGGSVRYERVVQSSYVNAEWFCRGILEAGAEVSVWHSDVAGDVLAMAPWKEGPGELWREHKNPPGLAMYADVA